MQESNPYHSPASLAAFEEKNYGFSGYAGFWKRLIALIIDSILVQVIIAIFSYFDRLPHDDFS